MGMHTSIKFLFLFPSTITNSELARLPLPSQFRGMIVAGTPQWQTPPTPMPQLEHHWRQTLQIAPPSHCVPSYPPQLFTQLLLRNRRSADQAGTSKSAETCFQREVKQLKEIPDTACFTSQQRMGQALITAISGLSFSKCKTKKLHVKPFLFPGC